MTEQTEIGQLALLRKFGQKTFIGKDIEIVINSISRCSCELIIRAPKNLSILREEAINKRKVIGLVHK